jgi:rhamnulokinase
MRSWAESGEPPDIARLIAHAATLPDEGLRVDVDDPAFLAPGDMPARIAAVSGRGILTPAQTTRVIVDSLADAFARTMDEAAMLAGEPADVVHLVGGGARNEFLCRRTAERTARPVVAGPVEATALGNILVQARTHGAMAGSLEEMRARIARTVDVQRYEPTGAGVRR